MRKKYKRNNKKKYTSTKVLGPSNILQLRIKTKREKVKWSETVQQTYGIKIIFLYNSSRGLLLHTSTIITLSTLPSSTHTIEQHYFLPLFISISIFSLPFSSNVEPTFILFVPSPSSSPPDTIHRYIHKVQTRSWRVHYGSKENEMSGRLKTWKRLSIEKKRQTNFKMMSEYLYLPNDKKKLLEIFNFFIFIWYYSFIFYFF